MSDGDDEDAAARARRSGAHAHPERRLPPAAGQQVLASLRAGP